MIINSPTVSTLTSLPFIGYDNVVTTTNVTSSSTDANYPASNVANPALNLRWQAAAAGDVYLQATLSAQPVSYVAIAGHNFNSQNIGVSLSAYGSNDYYEKALLHFDVNMTDESGKTWTAAGNAATTSAVSKFGRASLALDGSGDWVETPNHADFTLGTGNWTVDGWFKPNFDGADLYMFGQANSTPTIASTSLWTYRHSGGVVIAFVSNGTSLTQLTSATTLTSQSGWMHIAIVRDGNVLRMFINGSQESTAAFTGAVNPSTNKWVIGSIGEVTTSTWSGWIDEFRISNGIARWVNNFTPPTAPYNSYHADPFALPSSSERIVLHFDGANNSTTFVDQASNIWTPSGNVKIDATEDAAYFDGTGDYIDTPNSTRFVLGSSDFTIEMWVKFADSLDHYFSGHCDAVGGASTNSAWYFHKSATGIINFYVVQGVGVSGVASTSTINGWTHVAVARSGSSLRIFINGVLEGTGSIIGAANTSTNAKVGVGSLGNFAAIPMYGWIDEFIMTVGTAKYTSAFTPTPRRSASSTRVPPDDGPIVFRFPSMVTSRVRLNMYTGDAAPQVAVMYAGTLLEMERSIDIAVTHTPINMGRQSRVASGKAENGKFIGRIVLGEWNAGSIDFKWFTPTWFRAYFDPFLATAVEKPFFIAWNPNEYPLEVGYVALTNDAKPEVDTVTKRVHVKLDFQGEAA